MNRDEPRKPRRAVVYDWLLSRQGIRVCFAALGLAAAIYASASLTGGGLGTPPWWTHVFPHAVPSTFNSGTELSWNEEPRPVASSLRLRRGRRVRDVRVGGVAETEGSSNARPRVLSLRASGPARPRPGHGTER